jgi:hypothetical protein
LTGLTVLRGFLETSLESQESWSRVLRIFTMFTLARVPPGVRARRVWLAEVAVSERGALISDPMLFRRRVGQKNQSHAKAPCCSAPETN